MEGDSGFDMGKGGIRVISGVLEELSLAEAGVRGIGTWSATSLC